MPNKGTIIASLVMVSGISIFLYGFFFGWFQCLSGCISDPTFVPIYGILIALMGIPILFRINTSTRIVLGSIPIAFLSTMSRCPIFHLPASRAEGVWYYGYPFSFTGLFGEGPPLLQTMECSCRANCSSNLGRLCFLLRNFCFSFVFDFGNQSPSRNYENTSRSDRRRHAARQSGSHGFAAVPQTIADRSFLEKIAASSRLSLISTKNAAPHRSDSISSDGTIPAPHQRAG